MLHNSNSSEEIELLPDPNRVIEGLRDTGYDFNTAIADIIDNSISALASRIDIRVYLDPVMNMIVSIADNGCGMDFFSLQNAMRYGSSRRADPSSLGKFGLGLKTASTAFCRQLSVVSRAETSGETRKVQWDLDYIAEINKWKLKVQDPSPEEVEILENTAGSSTGTLVIWDRIDRLFGREYKQKSAAQNALNKVIDQLIFHVSMVYEHFIIEGIAITINEKAVLPWDPFCKKEANTEMVSEHPVEVELPDGTPSSFMLRAYVLPPTNEFSSKESERNAKLENSMQGFYIYREKRLIHHGDWLGMYKLEPHGTLLRVEFVFDHTLDTAFSIDIKKSRVILNQDIFDYIKEQFLPAPRRAADERYRKGINKRVDRGSQNAHDASNKNIDSKANSVEQAKVTVVNPNNGDVEIENKSGTFRHKLVIKNTSNKEIRILPTDSIDDGLLWEPCINNGKHAVNLNTSHPYYQKIYFPVLGQNVLVTGMDALIWALSEGELSTYSEKTKEQYEDMRYEVSRILKKLVADLPDVFFKGENDDFSFSEGDNSES